MGGVNDISARDGMWRRFDGDDWAAFDALPSPIQRRMQENSYDVWAVNALMLWRSFRRCMASSDRAIVSLRRYIDACERLEREAFAAEYLARHGIALPHAAAGVSVLRRGRAGSDDV